MCNSEKSDLLNILSEPIGYSYDSLQDIFVSKLDASQKIFGYTTLYDLAAPFFNMIFDYETFYFDYNNRTWLIEMWKGQYGINTGCELGIYYADKIVEPDKYKTTLFKVVDAKDMLDIRLKLNKYCNHKKNIISVGNVVKRHWWLTIFKMGCFTKPANLFVNTAIGFKDYSMMYSFLDSFKLTMPTTTYKTRGLTVFFNFDNSKRKYSIIKKLLRNTALLFCKIYCKLFNHITRPFCKSGDKLLYLYFFFPFALHRIFRTKKNKNRNHQ